MNPKVIIAAVVFVVGLVGARASQMFILDDGEYDQNIRVRRQAPSPNFAPQEYGAPLSYEGSQGAAPKYQPDPAIDRDLDIGASSYKHGHYKPGKVGPVYTFVKTDYHGNAKWGVRHVVGKKYAGSH
ncbi:hypothetical protein TCAL_04052 [Tigriopus californicus]|uniref:Uncharacterized protein n=1 Tax=Tigriopus californicus TaxID=6832 RepID=A0A553PFZ3_TIGCA|nr:uncharacterized protein LOC131880595 [Tigriopus californicus]TRY76600.1 hypothetical protein TCAL_04052 [Tigriopus californicus]|eukprot:TCALIF_04052-PA protein Name:"Protein of unknown function" AED:0.00 eAED:0.00 QI:90/1/1/1/1/1/3/246/126